MAFPLRSYFIKEKTLNDIQLNASHKVLQKLNFNKDKLLKLLKLDGPKYEKSREA